MNNNKKSIPWIFYLELFDTAIHACGWRQEGHPVVKNAAPILFISTPGKGALYFPIGKQDYKPMMMMNN